MKSIRNVGEEQLNWIQPKALEQTFELRGDEDLYASLIFPKSLGSLAEAEASNGKWTFKRVGFFNVTITIREVGKETDLAVYKPKRMSYSGSLEFTNSKIFHWQSSNFWSTKFEFQDANNNTVVAFRSGIEEPKLKDWFKTQARVEFSEEAKKYPELELLILCGWYLIIALQLDSSAGAVVAAAS